MPIWCDMLCEHAEWPDDDSLDGSRSCRTFIAVYCKKYERINSKNGPCLDATLGEDAVPEKSKPKKSSRKKTSKKKNS